MLLPVGNAYAHHSSLAVYESNETVKLTGVVVEYKLRSSHVHILMDVKNAAGAVERWTVESGAVGSVKRMGLDKDKVKPGDVISVVAWPNRKPERRLVWLNQITRADGTVVGGTFQDLVKASLAKPVKLGAGAVGIKRMAGRWEMPVDFNQVEKAKTPLPLTQAGRDAEKKFDRLRSPGLTCEPGTLPWLAAMSGYLYELKVSSDKELILHHELWDVVRTVPLNAQPTKADKAGLFGLVSGRVEGDAIVVDSSGYPASRWGLAGAGTPLAGMTDIPSSVQKKVTERYSVSADGNTLTLAYTVSDPVYLTKPYSGTATFHRVADDTPMDFKCDVGSATEFAKSK